jgi:hypothetical protein
VIKKYKQERRGLDRPSGYSKMAKPQIEPMVNSGDSAVWIVLTMFFESSIVNQIP